MSQPLLSIFLWMTLWLVQPCAQQVYYDQVAPRPGHPEDPGYEDAGWLINDSGTEPQPTQSFTPCGGAIDFIDLRLRDYSGDGRGATVYIVLRAESVNGPIIASTDPVALLDGHCDRPGQWTRFMFPSTVRIAPFQTHYFQPMVQPGTGGCMIIGGLSAYTAGVLYVGTEVRLAHDMFFREGVIKDVPAIPEPSTVALALAGLPALAWAMRKRPRPSLC